MKCIENKLNDSSLNFYLSYNLVFVDVLTICTVNKALANLYTHSFKLKNFSLILNKCTDVR